jgi:hypothetical protein
MDRRIIVDKQRFRVIDRDNGRSLGKQLAACEQRGGGK